MFTSIDKRWINDQFTKGVCLTMIVEQIVNRPGDVPKEKKVNLKVCYFTFVVALLFFCLSPKKNRLILKNRRQNFKKII